MDLLRHHSEFEQLDRSGPAIEDIASTPSPKRKRIQISGDTLDLYIFSLVRYNVPVSHLLNDPVAVARPFTAGINISSVSNALCNIQTSNLKFLPRTWHHGLRYRKESAQCGPLGCGVEPQVPQDQEVGAEDADTPSDVIEFTDGTNSCCVMSANLVGKGYVQMTGGDPEKSQDIAKQIISKEAGTWMHNGDCSKSAISRNTFYLGDMINVTKMNLVQTFLLSGSTA
ncbi:3-hydroxyisobutyrate dehydrogenase [Culex quinquefasciatus]|uniref:3-hydroxyisobutyrate dehydrogenase n=1 Tax=Culex quinquefasciatus TaxID=7176 RepID=B0X5T0_CULQU|nr:3-hydroxyisobutyrate dehydrogenase [Culex quinquefasciatus]|eukprot:XP_001865002.1 3-hydroxyisobutyrate dehydrogenase [Culex quinquefasciatus]